MKLRFTRFGAIVTALVVVTGACGGDDDGGGDDGGAGAEVERISLTVATPFPSATGFYDLYAADGRGYFDEENLDVSIEPLDGSGATLQAVQTGSADVAVSSPGPLMQAVEEDGDFVSMFTGYQEGIFSLVTLADSGVRSIDDLRGTTVGVGALDGGETTVVKSILSEAGLEEGADYELLAVGDGGTASTALSGGDVSAYGAAFIDVLILGASGFETRDLTPEDFELGTDEHYVVTGEMFENDRDVIERFARALAKGHAFAIANPDQALNIACEAIPEECEDRAFAEDILAAVMDFKELPESADGQWGFTDLDAMDVFAAQLVEQGELAEEPDVGAVFRNDYVEAYNDFDEADL
jgi:NitT/TauT family transport system substrate-binding protein